MCCLPLGSKVESSQVESGNSVSNSSFPDVSVGYQYLYRDAFSNSLCHFDVLLEVISS